MCLISIHAQNGNPSINNYEKLTLQLGNITDIKSYVRHLVAFHMEDIQKIIVPNIPQDKMQECMSATDKRGDELRLKVMNSYKKHFTENEISNILKFYTSKSGMKLLDKNKSIEEHNALVRSDWAKGLDNEEKTQIVSFLNSPLGTKMIKEIPAIKKDLAVIIKNIALLWRKDIADKCKELGI